jgi:hypothetical protein
VTDEEGMNASELCLKLSELLKKHPDALIEFVDMDGVTYVVSSVVYDHAVGSYFICED